MRTITTSSPATALRRFVIAYYVQTRDMRSNLAPENYTVVLRGLNATQANITAYDPMSDAALHVTTTPLNRSRASLTLSAVDYARLLIIEETATPAPIQLKAEAGNRCVTLSWPAVAGAAAYHVYRATGDGPFTHLASRVIRPQFLD